MEDWFGAYNSSLRGIIADEAFSHPAKFNYGLICRIYAHLLGRGWLQGGDLVADPFAGVGVGGIVAAANGLYWIGCELEEKFCKLAEDSFPLHREQWERMGKPYPVIVQGDSRSFSSIIREAVDAIVTSPPYGKDVEPHRAKPMEEWRGTEKWGGPHSVVRAQGYGQSEGQLGGMPEGDHGAVIDGIVTSPPYSETHVGAEDNPYILTGGKPLGESKIGHLVGSDNYGTTEGQIGQADSATYWQAVSEVYQECLKALKPGGVMAVVVKAFVRKKKIVDLPSQTLELLEAIGFEPLERIRAWMTSPVTQKSLMPDIRPDYTKKRASFFRRLYEKKYPENAIDFEEVLIVRKPL